MPRARTTADVFNAIAEPRRRLIVELLARRGALTVGTLVVALGLPQPSVSKHLGVLREVGLVSVTSDGKQRIYSLEADKLKTVHDWVMNFEQLWDTQLDRVKQRAAAPGAGIIRVANTDQTSERFIMKSDANQPQVVESFEIVKEIEIAAPIDVCFESLLDDLGPEGQMPGGKPFPMTIEPRPGGRWYRDLGDDAGHLWGFVQVIKPPTLLEICGPLMMSSAVTNHLQYRFTNEGDATRLAFVHRSVGLVAAEHRDGLAEGWEYWLNRVRELAEAKKR